MRVLLLFGSFNPIHNGHIALAEELLRREVGEQVWFVVSPQNPLKKSSMLIDIKHRLAMAYLALKQSPFRDVMKVCQEELSMPIPSYTIDTLKKLSEKYVDTEFCLIIGSDNVDSLDRWRQWEVLLRSYKVFVYPRDGYVPTKFLDRVTMLSDMTTYHYCSSQIREALSSGNDIDSMICHSVKSYIIDNGLWNQR